MVDAKRIFDIAGSLFGIAVTAPVLVGAAAGVFVAMGSPVIFRQQRPGVDGEPFTIYKFRTMSDERDADGELLPDKERLGRFGRFLRASSIDELPELFNVLKGDMSLVGPRPLLMEYLPRYSRRQFRRHEVRPGITGLAQVEGRNQLSWPEKFERDVWYVDNHNLWIDLQILLRTVWQVLRRDGISQEGRATVEYFQGESSEDVETRRPRVGGRRQ